jgi:hypothetical protein
MKNVLILFALLAGHCSHSQTISMNDYFAPNCRETFLGKI